jgi:hypothetical protein
MNGGSEDLLVGFIAALVTALIANRIVRGVRQGRLPVYRTYFERRDGAGRFNVLLALHIVSLIIVAVIAADLLFDFGLRSAS